MRASNKVSLEDDEDITMKDRPLILLVEDSESLARLYLEYLKSDAHELKHCTLGQEAIEVIRTEQPALVLLDLNLPDMNGREILELIMEEQLPSSVVVITAHSSVDLAVDLMRIGALDFIEKPIEANRLKTTVKNMLDQIRLQHMVKDFEDEYGRDRYHGFIGSSLPMLSVYRIIDAAAPSNASVFITGESGTGKEVCAEAIHAQGKRADRAFIAINCAAIPKDLMESEIFGHVKGAFTGATTDRKGAAAEADGGTLFLDELGEMDIDLQSKLLRFIQTGEYQRVGDSKVRKVDVRFISATNRDPIEAVAAGTLREDLYYRLHVVPVHIPPLRERGDDIIEIALHFLKIYAEEEGKSFKGITAKAEFIFRHYAWPGNVRQLLNVVRNIVVLNDADYVDLEHLPPPLNDMALQKMTASAVNDMSMEEDAGAGPGQDDRIRPLADVEREAIENAIRLCDGNIPKAAGLLEVSPSTLYRKKQAWE